MPKAKKQKGHCRIISNKKTSCIHILVARSYEWQNASLVPTPARLGSVGGLCSRTTGHCSSGLTPIVSAAVSVSLPAKTRHITGLPSAPSSGDQAYAIPRVGTTSGVPRSCALSITPNRTLTSHRGRYCAAAPGLSSRALRVLRVSGRHPLALGYRGLGGVGILTLGDSVASVIVALISWDVEGLTVHRSPRFQSSPS